MQTASQAYKAEMKKQLRDRSYIRVTIGLINQEAQASASVPRNGIPITAIWGCRSIIPGGGTVCGL